jgi:TPR repeat protein
MRRKVLAAALLVMVSALPAHAAGDAPPQIDPDVLTEGFLAAHPDLRWRAEGVRDYAAGRYEVAMSELKRAARYADKPAQAMIAEMYWEGVGVPRDRALGYAWMDIAAERMYHDFLAFREAYWNQLSDGERKDAIARGRAVLAEYGDDAAKPRLEKVLRREGRNVTGSRVGFTGNLRIIPFTGPLAGTGMTISGDRYYAKEYWEPKAYWKLQDKIWKAPPPHPRVDVGPLQPVDSAKDGGQPQP